MVILGKGRNAKTRAEASSAIGITTKPSGSTRLRNPDMQALQKLREETGRMKFPIIIEFKVPDPALLVPDFDADTTAGSAPYYRHSVKSPTVTAMKAMGVSRETGKWGYKGRVPASFFKWVYYYNPYLKKWKKSNPDVWQRLLDKYDIDMISWKLGLQGYRADNRT